jgi:hypothetical protein
VKKIEPQTWNQDKKIVRDGLQMAISKSLPNSI